MDNIAVLDEIQPYLFRTGFIKMSSASKLFNNVPFEEDQVVEEFARLSVAPEQPVRLFCMQDLSSV